MSSPMSQENEQEQTQEPFPLLEYSMCNHLGRFSRDLIACFWIALGLLVVAVAVRPYVKNGECLAVSTPRIVSGGGACDSNSDCNSRGFCVWSSRSSMNMCGCTDGALGSHCQLEPFFSTPVAETSGPSHNGTSTKFSYGFSLKTGTGGRIETWLVLGGNDSETLHLLETLPVLAGDQEVFRSSVDMTSAFSPHIENLPPSASIRVSMKGFPHIFVNSEPLELIH